MRGVRRLLTYGTVSLVITIIFMLNPGSAISMLHELNDNYIYDDLTGLVWYENLPALNEELYYLGGADTLVWYGMGSVSHLYDDVFDVNGDGRMDELNWRLAEYDELNNFLFNTGVGTGVDFYSHFRVDDFLVYFSVYAYDWDAEPGVDPRWKGYTYEGFLAAPGGAGTWINYGETRDWGWDAPQLMGDYEFHCGLSECDYVMTVADVTFAPVPEPSTMLLFGSGLVGLIGLRRKFRKR